MEMYNSHSGNIHWDHDKQFNQLQDNSASTPLDKSTFNGADADGLMTLFMNNPATRQLARSIIQYKATAVLGALSYKAHENWHSGKSLTDIVPINGYDIVQASPLPRFTPEHVVTDESLLLISLMKVMVAASNSAGASTSRHKQLLISAKQLGFNNAEVALLNELMRREISVEEIAGGVNLDKEKSELYIAAYTASNDNPLQRDFLIKLASAMALPQGLTTYLERQADLGIAA